MGLIKAVVSDLLITFMWMFCVSSLGIINHFITSAVQIYTVPFNLSLTVCLIFVIVLLFDIVSKIFGGAVYNPTATAGFYAAGLGNETLVSMAFRFPAQAAGAVGGSLAISQVIPGGYKHMLGGPSLKVDLHRGAIAEGILTFFMTMAVLLVVVKAPRHWFVRTLLLAVSTVALILAGAGYTGPSMNPVNAYGWAYINNCHSTWDHFYVYWISPFIGAIAAGWFFRVIFPKPAEKAKKA